MRSVARFLLVSLAVVCGLAGAAAPVEAQRIDPGPEAVTPARPADAWWGEDKIQHFAASAAITTIAYSTARIGLASDDAMAVAIGTAAVAGLLREVHDARRGRIFSVRDLVWDALGIAAGYLWIRELE